MKISLIINDKVNWSWLKFGDNLAGTYSWISSGSVLVDLKNVAEVFQSPNDTTIYFEDDTVVQIPSDCLNGFILKEKEQN